MVTRRKDESKEAFKRRRSLLHKNKKNEKSAAKALLDMSSCGSRHHANHPERTHQNLNFNYRPYQLLGPYSRLIKYPLQLPPAQAQPMPKVLCPYSQLVNSAFPQAEQKAAPMSDKAKLEMTETFCAKYN